nr:putative ribonuclease h protein [Quercus suber]
MRGNSASRRQGPKSLPCLPSSIGDSIKTRIFLWAKVLLSKYCSLHYKNSLDLDKLPYFSNWATIKVEFPIFKQGICWNVGNKLMMSFWESNWVKGNAMRELIEGPLAQHEETQTISDIHQNGYWNFYKISFVLPRVVIDRTQAIPIQSFGEKEDTLMWKFSANGDFNMALAYLLAILNQPKPPTFRGADTLPKIRHFLWLCNHASITTRQVIKNRGINCSMLCPLCSAQEKSIIHTLRDCPFVRKFWLCIGVSQALTDFLSLDLLDWLKTNCLCSSHIQANGLSWCSIFLFAIWW